MSSKWVTLRKAFGFRAGFEVNVKVSPSSSSKEATRGCSDERGPEGGRYRKPYDDRRERLHESATFYVINKTLKKIEGTIQQLERQFGSHFNRMEDQNGLRSLFQRLRRLIGQDLVEGTLLPAKKLHIPSKQRVLPSQFMFTDRLEVKLEIVDRLHEAPFDGKSVPFSTRIRKQLNHFEPNQIKIFVQQNLVSIEAKKSEGDHFHEVTLESFLPLDVDPASVRAYYCNKTKILQVEGLSNV